MYRSSNIPVTSVNRRCFMECTRSSYLNSALYDSVIDGDLTTADYLLTSKMVDPNFLLDDYDAAPLHTASGIGTEDLATKLVELLLRCGANPNIKTSDGTTPLMVACFWGRQYVSNILLKFGADPWMEDLDGKNAFDYASENGHYQLHNVLKNNRINLSISNDDTVLDYNSRKFYILSNESDNPSQNALNICYNGDEMAAIYSDINSESNCAEIYSLNTAFVAKKSHKDSVSSTGTFMSAPEGDGEFSDFKSKTNPSHDKQVVQMFDDSSSTISGISSNSHYSILSYGTDRLKEELKRNNINHGPVTKTTKRVYQNLIRNVVKGKKKNPFKNDEFSNYPEMLQFTLKQNYEEQVQKWSPLENLMSNNFSNDRRFWRGGKEKQFFTYLLLDPFITNNLPLRKKEMTDVDVWRTFILSIFYVGKGKNSRPFSHLYEALKCKVKKTISKKVLRIQKIWKNSAGVICLHIFHNIISAEAHTREAAMIDCLALSNLTNIQSGEYYGIVKNWSIKQKQQLGIVLLHKALQIYLAEGERQIFPSDLS